MAERSSMRYIAQHFVKINGKMHLPGESIMDEIDPDKAERLLEKGAIRKAAEAPISVPANEDMGFAEDDANGDEAGDDGALDEAVNVDVGTDDEADEAYVEAEPMEIDVADSITAADEPTTEEKKPARKRRGGKEKA